VQLAIKEIQDVYPQSTAELHRAFQSPRVDSFT